MFSKASEKKRARLLDPRRRSFLGRIRREHYIYLALFLVSVLCMLTTHRAAFTRAWQSVRDLGTSVAIWFLSILEHEDAVPATVMTLEIPDLMSYIGFDVDEILRKLKALFPSLFDKQLLLGYLLDLSGKLRSFGYILLLVLPLILLLRMMISDAYLKPGKAKEHARWYHRLKHTLKRFLLGFKKPEEMFPDKERRADSKQYTFFMQKVRPKLKRALKLLVGVIDFGKAFWLKLLLFVWCVNLNVVTIAVSAFAVYFYFLGTFNVASLLYQLAKLLIDLVIMFSGAPLVIWIVLFAYILDRIRMYIGRMRFASFEARNRAFIEELPLSSLVTGWMASGKTALITDMGLSYEAILRDKALDMMYELDLRFPDFPWRNVEKLVEFGAAFGYIRSLVTVRDYIEEVRQAYNEKLLISASDVALCEACFGYDAQSERARSGNGLIELNIFDAICEYAQLYLIYHLDTSLIVSSYAVRSSLQRADEGHFPLYDSDFFARDSYYRVTDGDHMSHVIDYDMFRMGKKLNVRNSNVGIFEFGVCLMSEKGKERGNAVENQCFKKDDLTANPKNDLFDLDLKLRRHAATVGFYTFCKFFSDEQRPESVGVNEREVSQVIHMDGTRREGVLIPFFTLTGSLADVIRASFKSFYYKYRNIREDNTLLIYLLKLTVSAIYGYVDTRRSLFGFKEIELKLEDGSEVDARSRTYYMMNKKIFSGRYSTDCLKGVYVESIRQCRRSLAQLPTYGDIVASSEELKLQNSYFIRDVMKNR